jgi:hypothetical protein
MTLEKEIERRHDEEPKQQIDQPQENEQLPLSSRRRQTLTENLDDTHGLSPSSKR